MGRLVAVLPLKPGARDRAEALLREGPPFDLEETQFDRHQVFLTDREVVFVFEGEGPSHTLHLGAEDPALWKAAADWQACLSERPRVAVTAYSWERSSDEEGLSFESTPGPGDSEGGEVYSPSWLGRGDERNAQSEKDGGDSEPDRSP